MIMVHDIKLGQLDIWKRKFHQKFRRWLRLAKSCEPSILYRSKEHFGLNLKDLKEYAKRLKAVRMHILKNSLDPKISNLYEFLLKRDMKSRGISSSPQKPIPPKAGVGIFWGSF